jgi:hypothetical protein
MLDAARGLDVMKWSLAISCVGMEWISNVLETVWTSIIRDLCDQYMPMDAETVPKRIFVEHQLSKHKYVVERKQLFWKKILQLHIF